MLKHLAIIMDGNARWAEAKGVPLVEGHRRGAEAVRRTIEACVELHIPYLTLYAFSNENWNRPEPEVNDLMQLLRFYLKKELKALHKNNVKIQIIGNRQKLPSDIQLDIVRAEEMTGGNSALTLNIALSYGSRQEIIFAAMQAAEDFANGRINKLDEDGFSQYLYTNNCPDPDLLVRTGGEQRLSNFLLWQSAYTELFFTNILWPDFGIDEIKIAKAEFEKRERRYGARANRAAESV